MEPHAAYNSATEENDIALVKVNSEQDKQAVIALASISTLLQVGTPLEITGWGATAEGGAVVNSLRMADVNYVDTDSCNAPDAYNGTIKAGMICAGFQKGGVDTCQGDSGGPLVLKWANLGRGDLVRPWLRTREQIRHLHARKLLSGLDEPDPCVRSMIEAVRLKHDRVAIRRRQRKAELRADCIARNGPGSRSNAGR